MDNTRKNRLSHFIVAYVGVFVVLAAFGAWSFNQKYLAMQLQNPLIAQKMTTDLAYCDLPRITVSMNGRSGQPSPQLRADLSLEIAKKDTALVEGYRPHITESLNSFLSNVDVDQLRDKNALPKLRANMLKAVNNSGTPAPVHDVVFRELVIM